MRDRGVEWVVSERMAALDCLVCTITTQLQAENQISTGSRGGRFGAFSDKKKADEGPLVKICHDVGKLSAEQVKGLSSQVGGWAHMVVGCADCCLVCVGKVAFGRHERALVTAGSLGWRNTYVGVSFRTFASLERN